MTIETCCGTATTTPMPLTESASTGNEWVTILVFGTYIVGSLALISYTIYKMWDI